MNALAVWKSDHSVLILYSTFKYIFNSTLQTEQITPSGLQHSCRVSWVLEDSYFIFSPASLTVLSETEACSKSSPPRLHVPHHTVTILCYSLSAARFPLSEENVALVNSVVLAEVITGRVQCITSTNLSPLCLMTRKIRESSRYKRISFGSNLRFPFLWK